MFSFLIILDYKQKIDVQNSSISISNETNTIIIQSNISEMSIEAEDVIRNSFKYKNEHNLDKLLECYTDRNKNSNFRLDNLEYIEIIDLKQVTDESQYRNSIIRIRSGENNLKIKAIKIYYVKFNIKYKDDTIEPINSGETMNEFTLIKLKNSDKWLINDVGD